MHSAIIIVQMPENDREWQKFSTNAFDPKGPLARLEGVQQLARNVWQVNFQRFPEKFARLVDAAVRLALPCEILQLDAEPEWLRAGFDPTTTQGRSGG